MSTKYISTSKLEKEEQNKLKGGEKEKRGRNEYIWKTGKQQRKSISQKGLY